MIYYGLFFSVIGYVITSVLMDDVLYSYDKWLYDAKLPDWIKKPLGHCPVCFTGQLSLWGSIPLVTWNYTGIIAWFGVISINMIIVLTLQRYVRNKED